MSVLDECEMLVDELRDDPDFNDALAGLRDAINDAIEPSCTMAIRSRFAAVAEKLIEIMVRLETQR